MFQESRELPVTTPTKVGKYHQLAEWMREGAKRTKQCRKVFYRYDDERSYVVAATCAMGAATLGAGLPEWKSGTFCDKLKGEGILEKIYEMNDNGTSREAIADWLDSL